MEVSQGNSLCSYFKQKCHFFYKIRKRRENGSFAGSWGGVETSGREEVGKGCRGEYGANTEDT
jgi:hypothetical protein